MRNGIKIEEIVYFLLQSKQKFEKWYPFLLKCNSLRNYFWIFRLISKIYSISNQSSLNKETLLFYTNKLFEDEQIDKLKLSVINELVSKFPEKIAITVIENLIERLVVRELVDNFYDELLSEREYSVDNVLTRLWFLSSKLKELNTTQAVSDIDEILESGSFDAGGKTGISLLDELIIGYPKSGYTVIAGKTGIGKTYFMLNSFLASMDSNFSAVFISPEMSYRAIVNRLALLKTGYKKEFLRKKPVYLVDDLPLPHETNMIIDDRDYDKAKREFKDWFYENNVDDRLVCVDNVGGLISFHTIESAIIDLLEKGFKVDCVFIDAPEMLSLKWIKNEIDEIQQKSLFFNKIAIEYDIAVVVSWQLKKDTYKKKCNLSISDVKGRNEISQKASLILALIQDDIEKLFNLFRIETLKVRHDIPQYPQPVIVSSSLRLGNFVDKVSLFNNKNITQYFERLSELANMLDTTDKVARDFNMIRELEEEDDEDFPF